MQTHDENSQHSNQSNTESVAKCGLGAAIRRMSGILALLAVLAAGRMMVQADQPILTMSGDFDVAAFDLHADQTLILHAGPLDDLIQILQDMIDILEGRTPLPEREPDAPSPVDPVVTDEERDDSNGVADEADAAGVDVPEERIELDWNYYQVHQFLSNVIDAIEQFQLQSGG